MLVKFLMVSLADNPTFILLTEVTPTTWYFRQNIFWLGDVKLI